VDITLALAVTRFGSQASTIDLEASAETVCFLGSRLEDDCLRVVWGSKEQFSAELRSSSGPGAVAWPAGKTWPFSSTFEIPENASRASLLFAGHMVPLGLDGDQPFDVDARRPSPAPTPVSGQSPRGYFLGREHGVAVTALRRQRNEEVPGWARISVDLAVVLLKEHDSFAPTIGLDDQPGRVCFDGSADIVCLGVVWGEDAEFSPTLELEPAPAVSDVPWPRGMGWPVSIVFDAPSGLDESFLLFADHRIRLDLAGMVGAPPEYRFRENYSELVAGSLVYDRDGSSIRLAAIEHDDVSGGIVLRLDAVNGAEATDFRPVVKATAARVSDGGAVLDGTDDVAQGWAPVSLAAAGEAIAPGRSGQLELRLPRVVGGEFPFVEYGRGPPGAVLVQLMAGDLGDSESVQIGAPSFVRFQRGTGERRFWLADLKVSEITWEPQAVTVGRDVRVSVTVRNRDSTIEAAESRVALKAGDLAVGELELDPIPPSGTATAVFVWKAQAAVDTFRATADAAGGVEEDDESNNTAVADFGGASLPDLIVEGFAWAPASPSIDDRVTLTFTARNRGRGESGPFAVSVTLDGATAPRWSLPFDGLVGGATSTAMVSWRALAGAHTFTARADKNESVLETDESNNETEFSYEATVLSDLVVDAFVWEPLAPSPGDTVTFTVTARNRGEGATRAFTIAVFLDGESTPTRRLRFPRLGPGGRIAGTFSRHAGTFSRQMDAASHTFKAVADWAQEVPESDETNNERLAFM
jgi:hypothetical protein